MVRIVTKELLGCSFCGKSQDQVTRLIAGPAVYICDECVELCNHILADELARPELRDGISRARPRGKEPPSITDWDQLSDDDLLTEMVRIHGSHQGVDRAVGQAVRVLRARGTTWSRIGDALGMTRQSAWERFSGEE